MAKSRSFKNILNLIDAETNKLSPQESFLADLKRSIELDDAKAHKPPSKTYKPSMMNCIRASYYQLTGTTPDEGTANYTIIGIANSGTDIHQRIQSAVSNMKNNNMDCEYIDVGEYVRNRGLDDLEVVRQQGFETKLYHKKLNISFLCDGIIKYKNKYYILEIKTESSYKFLNRKEVDPKHYNQAITYSLSLGIDDVIFIYISRDLLDMKSFCLQVTPEMRLNILEYIRECDNFLVEQKVPPKPENVNRILCQYCNYKTQCGKDV